MAGDKHIPLADKPLTARQAAFIPAYAASLNGVQAALVAGYSLKGAGKAANLLLKDVRIRQAVDAALEKNARNQGLTAEWVLERIKAVAVDAEAGADRTNALRALELLGKYLKLFEKAEQVGGVTVVITSALPGVPGSVQAIDVTPEPVAIGATPSFT